MCCGKVICDCVLIMQCVCMVGVSGWDLLFVPGGGGIMFK